MTSPVSSVSLFSPLAAPFEFPGGEHAVLLLHGFTACPAQMIPLGKALQEAGFTVRCVRLPGHGTSPADMKKSTWQQWLQEVRSAARDMRSQYRHFSIAGLSMGGCLALILAAEMQIDACITLAAPTAPANKMAALAGFLYPVYPTVRNRKNRLLMPEYDLGYSEYPTKKVGDLNRIIRLANHALPRVTCPLLSIQSKKDRTIVPESMDTIQRLAASQTKEHVWLQHAPHVITLSDELPQITQAMIRFLRKTEASR